MHSAIFGTVPPDVVGDAKTSFPRTPFSGTQHLREVIREGEMIREDASESVWTKVVAVLSVTGSLAMLYLPLLLH